ncbi:MAG: hypothetical protein JXR76_22345 [Deltaproteobacteria bacterium]|nr:hypothetical protein [Deltaproteobacteria bacterium]
MKSNCKVVFICLSILSLAGIACGEDDDKKYDVGDSDPTSQSNVQYGDVHSGMYHLGPVDFGETQWHNACAPAGGYRADLVEPTGLGGEYLAGVSGTYKMNGAICDACILVKTAKGKSIVARVVTYGATNEPGDIDVSPSVYTALNMEEWPRDMTWELTACPDTGNLYYEFQTEANVWWSSLWVRNAKVPIEKVEVKSKKHPEFTEMKRGGDGTLTDGSGFGEGPFTLRMTGIDGQVIEEEFEGFSAGELIIGKKQFQ